jgi:hypothetical protein
MARSWPFEDVPEGGIDPRAFRTLEDFIAVAGDDVEGVIIRIGLHDAQLLLVDGRGSWTRWVYGSLEVARRAVEPLEIPVHEGEFPEDLRVRMNALRRPREDFDRGAYPEQGAVGPVIAYPENRPRRIEASRPSAESS